MNTGRSAGPEPGDVPMPARFVDLKRALVDPEDKDAVARLTSAWNDVLGRLAERVEEIAAVGSEVWYTFFVRFSVSNE